MELPQSQCRGMVLRLLAKQPVYDHDLGFLVINSFLKGYEATGNEEIPATCFR